MAPKKGKESLLELCNQATLLGNSISVRMLEYLSTVKNHPHGFRELATDFLDTCRILWSIEAGLTEASRVKNQFPVDMVKELDRKFRQTNDDFVVLNSTLLRFLDYERKGGFGRLQKGFRMMFADTDIQKMRDSLSKSRDALRMSALVFRWSLGDTKADADVGMGYTGLIAALDRMNKGRPTTTLPPLHPPSASEVPEPPPKLPVVSLVEKSSLSELGPSPDDELPHPPTSPLFPDRASSRRLPSVRSGEFASPSPLRESVLRRNGLAPTERGYEENSSDDMTEARTLIDDHIQELDIGGKYAHQVVRVKADPSTVPRWTPRQTGGNVAGMESALMHAVQNKQHKSIEQLLDSGACANGGEHNLLRAACFNRDSDTVRMLLLFGADPNASDRDNYTPLYSATKASFLEGAKTLIKYGANPNLSAGPDADSPLATAVVENKIELVQLYLMYGGNASMVLENGATALIKAMNKTSSRRMVELMLNYESDPNAKSGEGKSPLFEAIFHGRVDLMTLLLDAGADPNLPGPKHLLWPSTYQPKCLQLLLSRGADSNKTPGIMELAASIKNAESISILLKAGVSPNVRKDGVYTPLCSAIRDNSIGIVTLLLANGADPNMMASEYPAFKCVTHHRAHLLPQVAAAGADLNTPKGIIEKAIAHNNKEALVWLLDQGVNPNDRTPEGYTAMTTAIREDRSELLDLLLAKGADPGIRGQDWPIVMAVKRPEILKKLLPAVQNPRAIRGVMEMAAMANQLESIKLLLKAGVSVEDKNGGVFSPLTTAIREGHKEIVRFLLDEAGADPNAPGEHLPIIKAIRRYRDDTEIIEMLLARGIDINKMYRGWNAVLQAVENGEGKILRLFVERGGGIDLSATDENGRTVMDIVKEQGWDEAIILLSGSGEERQ